MAGWGQIEMETWNERHTGIGLDARGVIVDFLSSDLEDDSVVVEGSEFVVALIGKAAPVVASAAVLAHGFVEARARL